MTYLLTLLFMAIAVFLVLIILVQRGRGGGLSGAFGSGGGSSSAFGTKTGDVFTTVTVILFVVFMGIAIWLNFRFRDYKEQIKGGVEPVVTTAPSTSNPATQPLSLPPAPSATAPTSQPK